MRFDVEQRAGDGPLAHTRAVGRVQRPHACRRHVGGGAAVVVHHAGLGPPAQQRARGRGPGRARHGHRLVAGPGGLDERHAPALDARRRVRRPHGPPTADPADGDDRTAGTQHGRGAVGGCAPALGGDTLEQPHDSGETGERVGAGARLAIGGLRRDPGRRHRERQDADEPRPADPCRDGRCAVRLGACGTDRRPRVLLGRVVVDQLHRRHPRRRVPSVHAPSLGHGRRTGATLLSSRRPTARAATRCRSGRRTGSSARPTARSPGV